MCWAGLGDEIVDQGVVTFDRYLAAQAGASRHPFATCWFELTPGLRGLACI